MRFYDYFQINIPYVYSDVMATVYNATVANIKMSAQLFNVTNHITEGQVKTYPTQASCTVTR